LKNFIIIIGLQEPSSLESRAGPCLIYRKRLDLGPIECVNYG
jgi:hypothetical protein